MCSPAEEPLLVEHHELQPLVPELVAGHGEAEALLPHRVEARGRALRLAPPRPVRVQQDLHEGVRQLGPVIWGRRSVSI